MDNLSNRVAAIEVNAGDISAKVNQTYGTSSSMFGWSLTSDGFYLFSNKTTVMEVTEDEAKIGGWIITNKKIYSGGSGRVTVVQSAEESYAANWVFAAGGTSHNSYADCPFRVSPKGKLYATNAVITGKITATSGSFSGAIYADSGCIDGVTIGDGDNDGCEISSYDYGYGSKGCELGYYNDGTVNAYLRLYQSRAGAEARLYARQYITLTTLSGTLEGTWYLEGSEAVTSDASLKFDVSDLSNEYSTFFDNLRPVSFKYYNGTSGRLHTGFIAQEVLGALRKSNISTQNFAAYVEKPNEDGEITCYLRYEEFISLNTWQIQKLKARVAELETIVAKLQGNLI